ncbi:MAG: hypothetical protein MI974_28505 [Chitinophagales bacterium]|nr:hypothetical protein [Chitinophagales bacterium]
MKQGIVRLMILSSEKKRTTAENDAIQDMSAAPMGEASVTYYHPLITSATRAAKDISLELKLKEAINKAKSFDDGFLVIDSNNYLEHFKESIFLDYLRLLRDADVEFKINGLDNLDKDNIGFFISIFEQKKKNQELALSLDKKTLEHQRKTSRNKKSNAVKALTSTENLKKNKLKKRQISDLDPNNVRARKLIQKYKEEFDYSDYRISKELNEQEVLTSKNSKFQANTVKRQYDALKELEKQFHINEKIENRAYEETPLYKGLRKKEDLKEIPINFEYQAHIDDELVLKFDALLERDLIFTVRNNIDDPIFEYPIAKESTRIVFNIPNDTPIGPGRYYAQLMEEPEESYYKTKWLTFIVRKDVMNSEDPLNVLIPASDSQ